MSQTQAAIASLSGSPLTTLSEDETMFRASVRAVDVEHERVFKRPADLAHYLERASSAPPRDLQTEPNPTFEGT